jgi:CxxH/CxxC protein (TIGR04129 family)
MMYYACDEHINLAIDMTVDEQESAPIVDKVEQGGKMLSTTCSFCENEAIYRVNP